jgi:hypothetical protein
MGIDVRMCINPNDAGIGISPGITVAQSVEREGPVKTYDSVPAMVPMAREWSPPSVRGSEPLVA